MNIDPDIIKFVSSREKYALECRRSSGLIGNQDTHMRGQSQATMRLKTGFPEFS